MVGLLTAFGRLAELGPAHVLVAAPRLVQAPRSNPFHAMVLRTRSMPHDVAASCLKLPDLWRRQGPRVGSACVRRLSSPLPGGWPAGGAPPPPRAVQASGLPCAPPAVHTPHLSASPLTVGHWAETLCQRPTRLRHPALLQASMASVVARFQQGRHVTVVGPTRSRRCPGTHLPSRQPVTGVCHPVRIRSMIARDTPASAVPDRTAVDSGIPQGSNDPS